MNTHFDSLQKHSTLLIFAYAPAGFGHLRVTDALHHGLPSSVVPVLLGSQDEAIRWQHRFISIHPWTRRLMEFFQSGQPEDVFSALYRGLLRTRTGMLYRQLTMLIEEQYEEPETVLVVATHFGLAHQLGALKKRFEDQKKIRLVLVVQVTDDSPQDLWYVPEADLIMVPSEKTKKALLAEGQRKYKGVPPTFKVNSYPVSPHLALKAGYWDYKKRLQQMNPAMDSAINVMIPISGAAVGTQYFSNLMDELHRINPRFVFHVVVKTAPYTFTFINAHVAHPYIKLYVSKTDREVVHNYEKLYAKIPIAIEITKPSEQLFKALLTPKQRGGALMFFSEPVGRQERDNLTFLQRHRLVPEASDREFFNQRIKEKKSLTPNERRVIGKEAIKWRGMELPTDPLEAAQTIEWLLREEVLRHMVSYTSATLRTPGDREELSAHGVLDFWKKVGDFLAK